MLISVTLSTKHFGVFILYIQRSVLDGTYTRSLVLASRPSSVNGPLRIRSAYPWPVVTLTYRSRGSFNRSDGTRFGRDAFTIAVPTTWSNLRDVSELKSFDLLNDLKCRVDENVINTLGLCHCFKRRIYNPVALLLLFSPFVYGVLF